jgi:hypothetical protein
LRWRLRNRNHRWKWNEWRRRYRNDRLRDWSGSRRSHYGGPRDEHPASGLLLELFGAELLLGRLSVMGLAQVRVERNVLPFFRLPHGYEEPCYRVYQCSGFCGARFKDVLRVMEQGGDDRL